MSNSSLGTTPSLPRRWLLALGAWIWNWLRSPWLAVIAGLIGIVLAVAAFQLPQLPGQLVDEQAAAGNWLLNVRTEYGIWGNPFLALGLFDVLRSPLLYLLLALLLATLAAQLADQLGALGQLREVQQLPLAQPTTAPGLEVPITPSQPLFRWRGMVKAEPEVVASALEKRIRNEFPGATRTNASILVAPEANAEAADAEPLYETRLLGINFPRLALLRPLLMIGLLTAVIGGWIGLAFGWQVTAPPLAPGATFRSANRNLLLRYSVAPTMTLPSELEVRLQGEEIDVATDQPARQRVGQATIQVRPAYPGIWVATGDGSENLTLPGNAKARSNIGFVFTEPGSEESILIPSEGAGVRIVQRGNDNGFVLELYRSDSVEPVYRGEITEQGRLVIPEDVVGLELIISTLPGLQVDVRHLPGLWLVWAGIVLALIGAIVFVRPVGFVLAQIAPWSPEYSIVVLQGDLTSTVDNLRAVVDSLAPATGDTDAAATDETAPPNQPAVV